MMDNYFGCDEFCICPGQLYVRVVGDFCQSFEEIAGLLGGAGKPPEVGRALEGDTNHIARSVIWTWTISPSLFAG